MFVRDTWKRILGGGEVRRDMLISRVSRDTGGRRGWREKGGDEGGGEAGREGERKEEREGGRGEGMNKWREIGMQK